MRDAVDTTIHGEVVCEFDVFYVRTRLAAVFVMRVVTRDSTRVNALAVRASTILHEMSISFTAHALSENDAVLQTVVSLLTPDTKLSVTFSRICTCLVLDLHWLIPLLACHGAVYHVMSCDCMSMTLS